jgi:hypothetical protein
VAAKAFYDLKEKAKAAGEDGMNKKCIGQHDR